MLITAFLIVGCSDDSAVQQNNDLPDDEVITDIIRYSGLRLAAQANTAHDHLYDVDANDGYPINEYATRRNSIDFLYFYDTETMEFILCSPDYIRLVTVENFWAYIDDENNRTANATSMFRLDDITADDFDDLSTARNLLDMYESGNADNSPPTNHLAVAADDVFGFSTASGLIGLLKIVRINGTGTASTSLSFEIKLPEPIE